MYNLKKVNISNNSLSNLISTGRNPTGRTLYGWDKATGL